VISGGADPYHEVWTGPSDFYKVDLLDIDNLSQGRYNITVTDNLGCHTESYQDIALKAVSPNMQMDLITPHPPNYNVTCIGGTDGAMTVSVTSGITPPYDFWLVKNDIIPIGNGHLSNNYNSGDPDTYSQYTGLGEGKYTLIIHDANGCEIPWSANMKAPPPMVATFIKSQHDGGYNISCKGYNNGSITIQSTTGGWGGYTYNWSTTDGSIPGPTNLDHIDNLTAGTYTVEIRDFKGCIQPQSTTITEPGGMQLTGYQLSKSPDGNFNVSCNGGNDGSISMTITGGSGSYVFSWSGPAGFTANTKDISGLKAGVYICTVEDLNGCLLTPSPTFTLNEPAPLVFSSLTTSVANDGTHNINCYGSNTGWISFTVSGGSSGAYRYDWSTSDGTGVINGNRDQNSLTAGTYHLVVTDANNCVLTKDFVITQPSGLNSNLTASNITCKSPGFNNGSIILTTTGGVEPYSYLWSNGATTKDITGLTQGNYNVTVTDINGCVINNSAVIELPPTLNYTKIISDFNGFNISCNGLADGSIQVDPTSGAPPFSYAWTGPGGFNAATNNIAGLRAGQYHLLIVDNNECKASEVIDITEPGKLDMNFTLSASIAGGYNVNCTGDNTGSIDVVAVNQVNTVDYLWADGIFGKSRTNLSAGNYSIIITDANNCHASSTVTLTQPDSLKNIFKVIQPFCPDKPDGTITANVTGGVKGSDYYYRWTDNTTNKSLLNIPEGIYKLTIADLNGCSIRDSVTVIAQNETCLVIPNAISPNGDLINDVWNIGLKELYPNMEVKIFNRWGESIWKSAKGYPEPWDGTSNGKTLPIDSYHYIIDLHDGSKPIVGNITIVR
jgi:gliding motility-associated-like protein